MTRFEELARQVEANASTATPMPKYRRRQEEEVWALKIKEIETGGPLTGAIIVPEGNFGPVAVSGEFIKKYKPLAGGYLVFYEDGYRSFSMADVFEDGYEGIPE